MDVDLAAALGERVRFARQQRHQTQAVVAGLAGITTDYLYQIERGKKLPTLPIVLQLARVLRVSVSDLLGDPRPAERPIAPLEAGTAIHRALTQPLTGDDGVAVDTLHSEIRAAWRTWQGAPQRYTRLAGQLPALITATERLRRTTDGIPSRARDAQRCAVDLYGLVRSVAKRVGRVDLALLAADRGVASAEAAGNPVRLASARWNLVHVLLAQGQPVEAEAVARHATEALDGVVGDDLDALALQGSLRLLAAVANVRQGKAWAARDQVRSVIPLAARTGERNVCWTAFGPTNVAMYAVSVEVEAGDTSEGLRLAEGIEPKPSLSIERRVAFHLEQAKGYNQRQDYAGALVMLQAASVEAPEDIKYRPAARAALNIVVQRARGQVARHAASLATRVGVPVG
ncbi:MAG TPA: helix-turn-helix transcriptional regulator [Chloroflexota bacterium]